MSGRSAIVGRVFLLDDRLIHSAGDLTLAANCEFALLRRLDTVLGRIERDDAATPEDPMLARTSGLGAAHERRQWDGYRERFGAGVVSIERPRRVDDEELARANEATLAAVRAGADVVYQGTFYRRTTSGGGFLGYCDFLVRTDAGYQVIDTKLSRHARVPALLQLAAYADALAADGVPTAPAVSLVLGDGSTVGYPLGEIAPVFRHRRDTMVRLLDGHRAGRAPVSWGAGAGCGRCPECTPEVTRHRDLILVAGLRSTQRETLIRGGITTIDALAAAEHPVAGMNARVFDALRGQASAQVRSTPDVPVFEVIGDGSDLARIPAPDPGDVFFDFEGDPLWTEGGSPDWGLEYLFGVMEADGTFRPFWAHDRNQERQALLDFLDYVTERRTRFPHMHVYHYAAYEKTALLRLAGRYGVGEDAVDALLRENVLVDLYPVVRGAVRVGAPSYSIKKLEPLYMGDSIRTGLDNAADSITEYARFCALRDVGDHAGAAAILAGVADYNEYDCLSTLRLRDWLLGLASDRGVAPAPVQQVIAAEIERPDPTETTLRTYLGDSLAGTRSADQQAAALMAAALGYHRRERKPFWWAHFERLVAPADEWADGADVFVAESATVTEDWHKSTPRQRKLRRTIRLAGRWGSGSTTRVGDQPFALYDAATGIGGDDAAARGTVGVTVVALESETGPDGTPRDVVVVEELQGSEPHDAAPMALAPGRPVPTKNIEAAIATQAAAMAEVLPTMPGTAAVDILRRTPPRTRSGTPLPIADPDHRGPAIVAALLDLDDSYLAVQGPPGTGKTHTGAAVVAELVAAHGWRIGVVAQSHSVVENMLDAVVRSGVPGERVAKKPGSGLAADPRWTKLDPSGFGGFLREHEQVGCVIGGTAWDFAHPDRVPPGSLDLLVVDEAGQFSLANTVAVGISARNLLLLGDPQQLPQVSQGIHPEPVDTSALGWLAEGHGALPPTLGYFLDVTWRMHPDVCAAVSALSYEGRLHSKESVTTARYLAGVAPGVHTRLVEHTGNSTSSEPEAAAITTAALALIGRPWTPAARHPARPLDQGDLLVVAPYNAQVSLIREHLAAAGLGEVLVGTVDKFQGREAAVVFVSMTASSAADVPRGMGFLLSRNRLNVAISRGMWRAVIVRSPRLTDYLPTTPDGLTELGAFLGCHPG